MFQFNTVRVVCLSSMPNTKLFRTLARSLDQQGRGGIAVAIWNFSNNCGSREAIIAITDTFHEMKRRMRCHQHVSSQCFSFPCRCPCPGQVIRVHIPMFLSESVSVSTFVALSLSITMMSMSTWLFIFHVRVHYHVHEMTIITIIATLFRTIIIV